MDSDLTAQLDQLCIGDSQKSSASTSSPPPQSTTLTSLPPELLSHILESIPSHPSSERTSTLASLCLVNHLFEAIAVPILYREVHFDTSQDFINGDAMRWNLLMTITGEKRRKLVRGLKISAEQVRNDNFIILDYVLSSLARLEWVRIRWDHQVEERYQQRLVETIIKLSPRLKALEIPQIGLDHSTLDVVFSTLTNLETFKGQLPGPGPADKDDSLLLPNLSCRLSNLILTLPIHDECFTRLLRHSHQALTSLGLTFDSSSTDLDLSQFFNLIVLRIQIKVNLSPIVVAPDGSLLHVGQDELAHRKTALVRSLRKTLLSTNSVKFLTIISQSGFTNVELSNHELFDILPRSLIHISSVPTFLTCLLANGLALLKAIQEGNLPNLKRITVTPTFFPPSALQEDIRRQKGVENDLKITCETFEIAVDRAVPLHDSETHFHSGWGLDPYGDDSCDESEEDGTDSEEEDDSEGESNRDTSSGSERQDGGFSSGSDDDVFVDAEEEQDESDDEARPEDKGMNLYIKLVRHEILNP